MSSSEIETSTHSIIQTENDLDRVKAFTLEPQELQCVFSKIKCCTKMDCMRKIIKMPLINFSNQYASECQKVAESSENETLTFNEFRQFIKEARAPIDRIRNSDNELLAYLVRIFGHSRGKTDEKQNSNWDYSVYTLKTKNISVCRIAYYAIMGISENKVNYAQQLIRKEYSDGYLYESISKPDTSKITKLKKIFEDFGLDYNLYYNNVQQFIHMPAVPDTLAGLLCATFLSDFFDICGEQEVKLYFNRYLSYGVLNIISRMSKKFI